MNYCRLSVCSRVSFTEMGGGLVHHDSVFGERMVYISGYVIASV